MIGMKKTSLQIMTRLALSLALLVLFELFESNLLRMPQGGSISLASLIFLFVLPLFNSAEVAFLFFAWRCLMFFLTPPFFVSVSQLMLDYVVAYMGFLLVYPLSRKKSKYAIIFAIVVANLWRYSIHVITGTLYFGEYAGNKSVIVYSLIYNLTYMAPTVLVQLVFSQILQPFVHKIVRKVR